MRLIDCEALLKYMEDTTDDDEWMVNMYNADWIYSLIEHAPTVTPKEGENCSGGCEYCNGTKQIVSLLVQWGDTKPQKPSYYNPAIHHKFCPMCGARMHGREASND